MSVTPEYKSVRVKRLASIGSTLARSYATKTVNHAHVFCNADAVDALKKIPSSSIDLILTDPPYHATKKANIIGDTDFESDRKYLDWMKLISDEFKRILRPNGSVYIFCSPRLVGRIEGVMHDNFRVYPSITWTKPNDPGFDGWKQKMDKGALRIWYPHSERIIFAEPAAEGNLFRSTFANFIKDMRLKSGMTGHQLTAEAEAYGKVNHGGAVSNWEAGRNTPSEEQYRKICAALIKTGKIKSMPEYYEVIRPFNADPEIAFTDVWDFPNIRPYQGKHPAEKPVEMLAHIIQTSSMPGAIVLDCFGGSGSTARAAQSLDRLSLTIEIDPKWFERAIDGLKAFKNIKSVERKKAHQTLSETLPLFKDESSKLM